VNLRHLPRVRPLGFLIVVLVAATAVDLAIGYSTAPRWLGWWPSTWNAFQNFDRFGIVIAAGCTAYLTSNARKFGMGQWGSAAVRSPGVQGLAIMATVVSAVLAAHMIGIAVIATATSSRAAAMEPIALWLTIPTLVCSTVAWAGFAALIARWLPPAVALALAVATPFLVTVWLDAYGFETPFAVFTISNSGNYLYVAPTTTTLIVRLLAWGALAVTLAVLVGGVRGWRRSAALWVASGTAALALFNGLAFAPITGADRVVCRGSAPEVCVTQPFASGLEEFAGVVDSVWTRIPPELRVAAGHSPEVAGVDPRGALVAGPVRGNDESSLILDRKQTIARIGEAAWPRPEQECSDSTYLLTRSAFQVWWRRHFDLPLDGSNFPGEDDYLTMEKSTAIASLATRLDAGDGTVRPELIRPSLASGAPCFPR